MLAWRKRQCTSIASGPLRPALPPLLAAKAETIDDRSETCPARLGSANNVIGKRVTHCTTSSRGCRCFSSHCRVLCKTNECVGRTPRMETITCKIATRDAGWVVSNACNPAGANLILQSSISDRRMAEKPAASKKALAASGAWQRTAARAALWYLCTPRSARFWSCSIRSEPMSSVSCCQSRPLNTWDLCFAGTRVRSAHISGRATPWRVSSNISTCAGPVGQSWLERLDTTNPPQATFATADSNRKN